MSDLYAKVEVANKFTAPVEGTPQQDHSKQISFGLEWAQRHQAQQPAPPAPIQMVPIVPVAN